VRLRVPLRQTVVDALLAARPDDGAGPVRDLRLYLLGKQRIALEVVAHVPLLGNQRVRVEADVTPRVGFPGDGRLRLTLLNRGIVGLALNAFRSRLPDFVTIAGQDAAIDLGLLLRRGGLAWLVPLISRCETRVQPGVLWLEVDARIPPNRNPEGAP
jgi:hypothetical protein